MIQCNYRSTQDMGVTGSLGLEKFPLLTGKRYFDSRRAKDHPI